jgi:hypothetical protein
MLTPQDVDARVESVKKELESENCLLGMVHRLQNKLVRAGAMDVGSSGAGVLQKPVADALHEVWYTSYNTPTPTPTLSPLSPSLSLSSPPLPPLKRVCLPCSHCSTCSSR